MEDIASMLKRSDLLNDWLINILEQKPFQLTPLAGDASHRRYYRATQDHKRFVVMDAPPDKESCKPYMVIANTFRDLGLKVPEIFAADINRGFLLISDFGDRLLLNELNPATVSNFYHRAFESLLKIQSCKTIEGQSLPKFDVTYYHQKMLEFPEWYLEKWLQVKLSAKESAELNAIFDLLLKDALVQPQVCTHRDYHCRNLMALDDNQLGILDFQDASFGPLTYDLVSLLRDCYIDWPQEQVTQWVEQFRNLALKNGLLQTDDMQQYHRWFDWIGLQRHLRCIGLFARLHLRDHKTGYLRDIPRVVRYAKTVCERYPEFELLKWIFKKYVPDISSSQ